MLGKQCDKFCLDLSGYQWFEIIQKAEEIARNLAALWWYSMGKIMQDECIPILSPNEHKILSWWRHQMETSSALQALCVGNSPMTGEFPSQRPVTRNSDVFYDLRLNKRLCKQSGHWWFETPSRSLWLRCNNKKCEISLLENVLSNN